MARESYDAIVIGGGHNGLVAAAYLARSGAGVGSMRAGDGDRSSWGIIRSWLPRGR
jgi:glycine/D-amino acid oxidase-like deaminating enzyme